MPAPFGETPSTGGDNREEQKVEEGSEERRVKQFANKRSKSLGTLSDSKHLLPPHQRLSRRQTEVGIGGGIRVVWRTSPTTELENLGRILGISGRNRSVSPMKRPDPVDYVFSEYYDPLAFHSRQNTNPQEATTTNLNIPAPKRRNTLKKDSVTMPSVKKLLSIFERSAPTPNDSRNPNSETKVIPAKEHRIKFPKADKNVRLNQSLSGIANDVYGQYKSKDYSEVYEDNVAAAQKPKIGLVKTNSLPDYENETKSHVENNNSNNLNNLNDINHIEESIHNNEVPSRKEYDQTYSKANKIAKHTTSVSLLKQKWESIVKERTKPKKVSKPADTNENDDAIGRSALIIPVDALDKEFHRHHSDSFGRSTPFERNTTSRRSVKNIAKRYESMRESSTQSKEATEDRNKVAPESRKKIVHSKSFDNLRLLENRSDPRIVDIRMLDNESFEVRKEVNVRTIDASESLSLERKPSVRDLKKKFEVIQNNEQPLVSRSPAKKVELDAGLSPVKLQVTEIQDLISGMVEPKIQSENYALQINGDEATGHTIQQGTSANKQLLADNYIQIIDANTNLEQDLETKDSDISAYENNVTSEGAKIKKNESKSATEMVSVTKKSSIKIELSLSPPNPQKKTKLSVMPSSVLISDINQEATINANLSYPENTDAEAESKNPSGKKEKSIEKRISKNKKHDSKLVQQNQTVTENVRVTLRGEDSTLGPDAKPLLSEEIRTVNKNHATTTFSDTSAIIPTLNSGSEPETVQSVLITELRSPAVKNSFIPNIAEEGKRKKVKLTQMKSKDQTEKVDNYKIMGQTSRISKKELTTDTASIFNHPEGWKDNQSSKQININNKILESDLTVTTINSGNEMKTLQPIHKNETEGIENVKSTVNESLESKSMVDSKHHSLSIDLELADEQLPLKSSTSRLPVISVPNPDNFSHILTETESKSNVDKTDEEYRQQGQTQLDSSRNKQFPVPSERTKYLSSEGGGNSPESSFYTIYNSSKLTTDVKEEEQVVNPEITAIHNEKENVVSGPNSHCAQLNESNSEESLEKDLHKGGSKFRSRKAARRAYTDSLLKHLTKSDASRSELGVPKESEVVHPNEMYNLLYRKPIQDPTKDPQSVGESLNKSVPPFLGRKTRSKSATSFTIFNNVRELKPDEMKFFKDFMTPKTFYPNNSNVTKDRASSVATSSPASEGPPSIGKKNSFERSSLRDSQKYRKLHSDEMKFFGLNYTHN